MRKKKLRWRLLLGVTKLHVLVGFLENKERLTDEKQEVISVLVMLPQS